jgi:hypothetical protein
MVSPAINKGTASLACDVLGHRLRIASMPQIVK